MKKILMSIKPQYCAKIFNGEKTIEMRKIHPSIPTPYEVLVYETKEQFVKSVRGACTTFGYGCGKVIGSFVCDRIEKIEFRALCLSTLSERWEVNQIAKQACLTIDEMRDYLNGDNGYGWHITAPKLFEKPRELREFCVPCKEYDSDKPHCGECDYYKYSPNDSGDAQEECLCGGYKPLRRPPQSWCYVEDKR